MDSKTNSTKTNPLKYFEIFLKEKSFNAYEKRFFEFQINPSFKPNRAEGYIYYLKESYVNDEKPYVKLYFKEELKKQLILQVNISLSLINEKKDEIENTEKNANVYINRQLIKIVVIKNSINYSEIYQPIIFSVLEKLAKNIESYLEVEQRVANTIQNNNKIYSKSFFDLKEEIRLSHLRKLYDFTSSVDIIDDEIITQEEFIEIFTLPKLPNKNLKLSFNKDNITIASYLKKIAYLFNNLTPRAIHKSQTFFNKQGKVLNENDINRVNSSLKKNDTSKYDYIRIEIEKIFPK
ncbi:MAG: hypothetical protein ACI8ZX_002363 [Planctomycetota bacterium]|jgi:hypothetical protein